MNEATFGRIPQQVVEIVQPLCALTYGTAPCAAALGVTGSDRCYNTRATCQDGDNYDGSGAVNLYFRAPGSREVPGIVSLPFLGKVSTVPTVVNFASVDTDRSPLGTRATVNISMLDGISSDGRVDPYVDQRAFDPLTRSTFWRKWMTRNRYRTALSVRVYSGYEGQTLAEMVRREYVMEGISGPGRNGGFTIIAKDILSRVEGTKAQAPAASPGRLSADITEDALALSIAEAGVSDYPAPGLIRIGGEIIAYSGSVLNGTTGNVDITVTARGQGGTIPDSHAQDASVQWCLVYDDQRPDQIISDLLTTYGGIDAGYIPSAEWEAEAVDWVAFARLGTVISEPTSVGQLVGEVCEQGLVNVWWDERTQQIRLFAFRPPFYLPPVLDEASTIIADSLSITERPENRLSQVWVYYNRRNVAEGIDDVSNYRDLRIRIDPEAETADQYGEPRVKKIFGRWLVLGPWAGYVCSRFLNRRRETQRVMTFDVDAKDRSIDVGEIYRVDTWEDVDQYGQPRQGYWQVFSVEETAHGHVSQVMLEEIAPGQRYGLIMAGDDPDYTAADADQMITGFWISDANGKYSDGSEGKLIL